MPCPGYHKEVKWSTRHERLLRKEQPKSCAIRHASPSKGLFEQCANAIQQDSLEQAHTVYQMPRMRSTEETFVRLSEHDQLIQDEDAVQDIPMLPDQAIEDVPWIHQDDETMPQGFDDVDAGGVWAKHGIGEADDGSGLLPNEVDLDGFDVFETTRAMEPVYDSVGRSVVTRRRDDEHDAVFDSLADWRKQIAAAPVLSRSLIDVTTFLVDHWFRDVCSMWSAYDSPLNPNRILMSRMWTNSKAVLFSMKTMAATCLIPTLPHLKAEAASSARGAVEAIQEELEHLELSTTKTKPRVPLDLFLALLCVGTTMCWLDTNLLGLAYWKEARRLRTHYQEIFWLLDEEEQEKLVFFENSCVYWDMLASVVSNESPESSLLEGSILDGPLPSHLIKPHPWTGVSHKQQRLLSKTIALCRRHRVQVRERAKAGTPDSEPSIEDMMDAYMISNELELTDIPSPQSILDMGDRTSLAIHFAQLAKAFRIASLLQLHQTFRLDQSPYHEPGSQKLFVLKLALELIKILEQIPVWSNTRCTQPILYITAASGLRFESPPGQEALPVLTPEVLEVHRARKFILDRFAALQRSLPPKPIVVATELVQAVWRKYERESPDVLDVHWIDVMIDAKLSTLFG